MKLYVVVELVHECNKDKRLDETFIFKSRERALAYLREKFESVCSDADSLAGLMSKSLSEDGWYDCVTNDGDRYEGYVSEATEVQGC